MTLTDIPVADGPVEITRGTRRDDARLLVAHKATGQIEHARFRDLAAFLDAGDVLVINTSGTLPAAVPSADGALVIHLSTRLGQMPEGAERWVVEVREPCRAGSRPHLVDQPMVLPLAGGAAARLRRPHAGTTVAPGEPARLWEADIETSTAIDAWLAATGRPIRYGCPDTAWPIAAYQTAFTTRPGSAEMPSASRGFTPELVTELVTAGVVFAPLTLHTGVSSPEAHEPPYAERYDVPATTARLVTEARRAGGRIVAVGTTATRAIETDAATGEAHPGQGWTELVITPARGLRVVDGIISGWHEPEASHLELLSAVAGDDLLARSYDAALANEYLWHEFGDLHLVI